MGNLEPISWKDSPMSCFLEAFRQSSKDSPWTCRFFDPSAAAMIPAAPSVSSNSLMCAAWDFRFRRQLDASESHKTTVLSNFPLTPGSTSTVHWLGIVTVGDRMEQSIEIEDSMEDCNNTFMEAQLQLHSRFTARYISQFWCSRCFESSDMHARALPLSYGIWINDARTSKCEFPYLPFRNTTTNAGIVQRPQVYNIIDLWPSLLCSLDIVMRLFAVPI